MTPMKSLRRYGPLGFGFAFLILACSLAGNDNSTQTFSFNKSFDTLAQFDSVVITLKDTTGKTIDILYRGKADTIHEIENLPAKHWGGDGVAVLSIVGYDSGEVVYHVEKKFDGKNDQILDTLRLILPGTTLTPEALEFTLTEGDSVPLPHISVAPVELSDKSLAFISSSPTQLQVGPGYLRALSRGTVKLTASLVANPAKSIVFNLVIQANPLTPDSLQIIPDTLKLAANGAPGSLSVKAYPLTADPSVAWSMLDSSIARFVASGVVQGLKSGVTEAKAFSTRRPIVSKIALIVVSAPVAVSQVRFLKDSLDLFVGGAIESLTVEVLPTLANPTVTFSARDSALVSVAGGRIQGLAQGATEIIARSSENSALADTLRVTVFPTQKIDSIRVSPDSLLLYTGGALGILTGKVYPPIANQSLLWRIENDLLARIDGAGKVTALSPGRTRAIAL